MEKYKDDIKRIAEYARQQGCEDIMDFELQVKQLDMKLPSPQLGEKRITNLSRYIYLLNEKGKIDGELDKIGGLNG